MRAPSGDKQGITKDVRLRNDALHRDAEQCFDDLAALAAHICGASVGLLSVAGENLAWFAACVGCDREAVCRGIAECCRVLPQPEEMLLIPDICEVPQVRGVLEELNLPFRFLAIVTLVSPLGAVLGTLCVADDRPRRLTGPQKNALRWLSHQAVMNLELCRHSEDLTRAIRQRGTAQKEMRRLAFHDSLTGLLRCPLLEDRISQALCLRERRGGLVAVMFLDLDGFKAVNDTHGHAAGDALLKAIAGRLTSSVRRSDTVARLGGDEFAILCPNLPGPGEAARVAQSVLAAVGGDWLLQNGYPQVTASLGIALEPADGSTPDALLKSADAAMYQAKRMGKNAAAFASTRYNNLLLPPDGASPTSVWDSGENVRQSA